jgi:hypothetical protein
MKITIEPSEGDAPGSPKISGEIPSTHIEEISELIRGLLVAYGFCETTVREHLDPEYNLEENSA